MKRPEYLEDLLLQSAAVPETSFNGANFACRVVRDGGAGAKHGMTIAPASFGASPHGDDMRTQRFDFTNAAGARLSGRLGVPDPPVRTCAVLAHCFTCGKDNLASVRISRALARRGIGTLRFDFAGLGGSEGVFATGFGADVGDLAAAVRAMAEAGMVPQLLVGHSLGGAAVIAAAGALPMITAVATIGAPFDVAHVLARIDPATLERIEQDGEAAVRLVDRQFQIRRGFVEEAREQDQAVRIAALRRPLLVLHSPRDETVGIDHAGRIFQAAHHPKSFVSLDDADHLLSRATDADYVAEVITSWASRYLPRIDELRAEGQSGEVVVEETGAGRYQVAIRAGGIRWLADEPEAVGGLGSGPTPYDLLAAGLGACTTMTLRMYAERKNWPVEHIRTAVGHTKDPGQSPPDRFVRHLFVKGALSDEQRGRLVEIANMCPVHRTLTQGAHVETIERDSAPPAEHVQAHADDMAETIGATR